MAHQQSSHGPQSTRKLRENTKISPLYFRENTKISHLKSFTIDDLPKGNWLTPEERNRDHTNSHGVGNERTDVVGGYGTPLHNIQTSDSIPLRIGQHSEASLNNEGSHSTGTDSQTDQALGGEIENDSPMNLENLEKVRIAYYSKWKSTNSVLLEVTR